MNPDVMEGSLLVQHSEAAYGIKKYIVDRAKNHWKELREINSNHVLGASVKKQELLDKKFEEHITQNLGWQLGEQYTDMNTNIIFNTFLMQDDPRLDE